MKQLNSKIAQQKRNISHKKKKISRDIEDIKNTLGLPREMSWTTIGGLAIGFLLLPKKLKMLKLALKAYTVAATARQLLDLLPQPKRRKLTRTTHVQHKHLH